MHVNIERISVVINRICFRGIVGQIRNLAKQIEDKLEQNNAEFHQREGG